MEPTNHLGHSYNKHMCMHSGDVKVVCPLTTQQRGARSRKGAFVAFGNTEAFCRNMDMVVGHGPYCEEGEGGGATGTLR